jgi:ribosome-associated protein
LERIEFALRTPYIDLLQLLKATGLCATGGEAKWAVDEGRVTVNGESESRRRRKLNLGDEVVMDGQYLVYIVQPSET